MTPEYIARRGELLLGFVSLVLCSLATLTAIEFFFVREIIVHRGWSSIIPVILGPVIALLAGITSWIVISYPLRWWHHRRGVYRCNRCQAPLPLRGYCTCVVAHFPELAHRIELHARLPRRFARHLRQQIPRFAVIALILTLPGLIAALHAPARNPSSFSVNFGFFYAIMVHLAGLIGIVTFDILKRVGGARRLRVRYQITSELMLVTGTLLLLLMGSLR